jgi:hypothetical protein
LQNFENISRVPRSCIFAIHIFLHTRSNTPEIWVKTNTLSSVDASASAISAGGDETLFADDLSVFQNFPRKNLPKDCTAATDKCKENVHQWGCANRVSSDAAKEHMMILHASESHGEAFKLLGCMVDEDLRMQSAIEQILNKIRPKNTAILRTRPNYNIPDLLFNFIPRSGDILKLTWLAIFTHRPTCLQKSTQPKIDSCMNWICVQCMPLCNSILRHLVSGEM